MRGLDTNVLIRYFTQDDENQAEQVSKLLEQALSGQETLVINDIVLCELIWTLISRYSYNKTVILIVIEVLIQDDLFVFENLEAIQQALELYQNSTADFSDCLIGTKNSLLGCTETLTFDRKASALAKFTALLP